MNKPPQEAFLTNAFKTVNIAGRLKCSELASTQASEYEMYFDYNGWAAAGKQVEEEASG